VRNNDKSVISKTVQGDEDQSGYNTGILQRGIFFLSQQKLTPSQQFFKFIHTSLPF
jgi:hypothetical protein